MLGACLLFWQLFYALEQKEEQLTAANKAVAQGFMNQMGGGAASLITLNVKTACDISSLSFYPHEAEALLLPGTRLRVLSRKRSGNVAEIEVEEVVE